MTAIPDTIRELKRLWTTPREAMHGGLPCPFLLHCAFEPPAHCSDIAQCGHVPDEVTDFWQQAEAADLFKDGTFGQWGLHILSPIAALAETREFCETRPREALNGDLILATFFGDTDLLLVRTDQLTGDYGSVLVVSPLDPRTDWEMAAPSFGVFLQRYISTDGCKYWEEKLKPG